MASACHTTASGMIGLVPWPEMDNDGWCGVNTTTTGPTATPTATTAATATANPQEVQEIKARNKQIQLQAAQSKSGLWGPTHSLDSQESGYLVAQRQHQQQALYAPPAAAGLSHRTESNPNQGGSQESRDYPGAVAAAAASNKTTSSPTGVQQLWNDHAAGTWENVIQACVKKAPVGCLPRDLHGTAFCQQDSAVGEPLVPPLDDDGEPSAFHGGYDPTPVLGISRLAPPDQVNTASPTKPTTRQTTTTTTTASHNSSNGESAAARRRARHWNRLQRQKPETTLVEEIEVNVHNKVQVVQTAAVLSPVAAAAKIAFEMAEKRAAAKKAPLHTLEVPLSVAADLERSISELTMRSSYGSSGNTSEQAAIQGRIPDNRRMAYYAVGKHHRQSGRGGNRRCYFSGKLILGGAPFYAGSVQQGLRTLVVFCLPSALNMPEKLLQPGTTTSSHSPRRVSSGILSTYSRHSGKSSTNLDNTRSSFRKRHGGGGNSSVASRSRLSSLDDLSLSIDGDLDPNWGLDRDYLLRVLPDPDLALLRSMAKMYPEQFETLPVQVREFQKWKLYVKFCFFSGLPIQQGEMHYKVRDDIAESVYGEEIVLSHDVMEAVNGESAEMLALPNQKAFRYLRRHYAQQCSKLEGDRVFLRTSWERVLGEV